MITSMQYVALGIPDLKVGVDFYDAFGLEAVERADHVAMRCHGRAQDQIVLVETGRDRKLHHFSLGTDANGLAAIEARLQAKGIEQLDPPYAGAPGGLWFRDPEGTLVNIQIAGAAPWQGLDAAPEINRPGLLARVGGKGCPPFDMNPRPRRMGHFILFARDVIAQSAFYCDTLGFIVSDRIAEGYAAFMRLPGDSDHHVLAMLKSEAPGFHHASFEVESPDEIGMGAQAVIGAGYRDGWGFGRHVLGSNFFHYVRDPWMSMAEYFCDIDQIPGDGSWRAGDHPPEDALYRWGPPVPEDFGRNYEAA